MQPSSPGQVDVIAALRLALALTVLFGSLLILIEVFWHG